MSTNNPNDYNPNDPQRPLDNSNPFPPPPPVFEDIPPPVYGDPAASSRPPGVPPVTPGTTYTNPPHYNNGTPGSLTKDERNWAMFAHLSGLVVGLLASGAFMPFLSVLGPLVIYLMKKDESAFVADQAKEALNFNISVAIIMVVLVVLTFTVILAVLTIPMMIIVGIAALVLSIIAAVKSSGGEWYRYPFTLRLIK